MSVLLDTFRRQPDVLRTSDDLVTVPYTATGVSHKFYMASECLSFTYCFETFMNLVTGFGLDH